jgi:hypothetical protein
MQMRIFFCLAFCLAFSGAHADTPVRSPNCEPPERPSADAVQLAWDQFLSAADSYRVCISTYVERNQLASDGHRAAANQATLAWNEFVRTSLNAPRDYPAASQPGREEGADPAGAEAAESSTPLD